MGLKLVNFLENKLHVTKPALCILFAILIQVLYSLWFNRYSSDAILPGSYLANLKGDSGEYIIGAINMKNLGFYYPDVKPPGYSCIIYLCLFLCDLPNALDLVVLMQIIIGSISVYVLAKLAFLITKSEKIFLITFIVYALSAYVSEYDRVILAETFTISILIFSLYYLYRGVTLKNKWHLIYAGFGLCFTVYLRPILAAFLVSLFLVAIILVIKNKKQFRLEVRQLTFLLLPFLIILTLWGSRNYYYHKKIEPLMHFSGYYNPEKQSYYYDLHVFVTTWSGDMVFWNPTSEITWFGCGNRFKANDNIQLPDYIYTSKYDHQALVELRNKMRVYDASLDQDTLLRNEICGKLQEYSISFKEEKRLLYYLGPLKIVAKFIINGGGTTNLFNKAFSDLAVFEKAFKLMTIAFYLVISFSGILLSVFYSLRFLFKKMESQEDVLKVQLALFIIVSIFTVCFVYRSSEYRYVAPLYPACLLLIVTNKKVRDLFTAKRK